MPSSAAERRAIIAAPTGKPTARSGRLAERGLSMLRQIAASANRRSALGWSSLHIAALGDHRREAEILLEQGADVNDRDKFGHTPLFFAKSAYMAQILIAHGADVNARRDDGGAPLHRAARMGCRMVIKTLLEAGADISAEQSGATPLHVAARHGHWGVAEILLIRGADVDALDNWGRTPRDMAASGGHEQVVRLLERYGASR